MNSLCALFALIVLNCALAQEAPSFRVLKRTDRGTKTFFSDEHLEDLVSADSFDGKYFKVVKGKSNVPVSFTAEPELVLKAATTYYHATRARKFWETTLRSEALETLEKVTIRLEIINLYDEQGHFANDNRDPQFNNALSISEGETPSWVPADHHDKWGKEIWFRPMKRIDTAELAGTMGPNPLTQGLERLQGPFIDFETNHFTQIVMENIFYPNYSGASIQHSAMVFLGTVAMTRAVIAASRSADRLFMNKYYYLDTAMVPEVIYHEFAHIILSDYMKLTHSTPVVEGMADYFAAELAQKKKMYDHVNGYSNSNPKNPTSKEHYSHWKEANFNAAGDFVLAVLWDVRLRLGDEIGNKVIYAARKELETDGSINDNLLRAILDSCSNLCENPRRDRLKLYEAFSDRGF